MGCKIIYQFNNTRCSFECFLREQSHNTEKTIRSKPVYVSHFHSCLSKITLIGRGSRESPN